MRRDCAKVAARTESCLDRVDRPRPDLMEQTIESGLGLPDIIFGYLDLNCIGGQRTQRLGKFCLNKPEAGASSETRILDSRDPNSIRRAGAEWPGGGILSFLKQGREGEGRLGRVRLHGRKFLPLHSAHRVEWHR